MSSQGVAYSGGTRRVLSAGTINGDRVKDRNGEDVGKIEDIMIDLESGDVAYAVLSFGGFLGMGDKLFAVPWRALTVNEQEHEFVIDTDKQTLENAPGFDKDNWPDFADPSFATTTHEYYGQEPYWERNQYARPYETDTAGTRTSETSDEEVSRERVNQPDLPEELRRRPVDVTNFPGSERDADLRTSDPSRTYAVNDTNRWTRKS
jgi:sporulation protein YlmC with PRC-barrel domain